MLLAHGVRGGVLLTVSLLLGACVTLQPCTNAIEQQVVQPNGDIVATVFTRDCGATTSYTTHVLLARNHRLRDAAVGNVLVLSGGRPGAPAAQLRWLREAELEIAIAPGAEVFKQVKRHGDIQIVYASASS